MTVHTTVLPTKEEALRIIGPHLAVMSAAQRAAWTQWVELRSTSIGAAVTPRGRANLVYDLMVAQVEAVLPGGMCGRSRGFLVVDFQDLSVRLKKLDANLAPRSIPTNQSVMFEEQAQIVDPIQLELWPTGPMLILGYVLDETGIELVRQVLVLRMDDEVLWHHDLVDPATPLPVVPVAPVVPVGPRVASTRRREDRKEA